MNYDLTEPCPQCPFRTDIEPFLRYERVIELKEALLYRQGTFSCHKTNTHDEDGEAIETDDSKHCAGAMILLEKLEKPNQMMRIAERLGMYDRHKLKMDAPVFDDFDEMADAQKD